MKRKLYCNILCKVMLIISFVLILNSCIFRGLGERDNEGSLASFVVNKIEKSSEKAITFNFYKDGVKDGIKESFSLHLKTCIKFHKNPDIFLSNTPFTIEYYASLSDFKKNRLTRAEAPSSTDHNGCIQWVETYPYRYIHRALYIGLKRLISPSGKSTFSGKLEILMAVNPWLKEDSSNPEILDGSYDRDHPFLKEKYEKNGLKFLSEISERKFFPQLWVPLIDDIKISPNPSLSYEKPSSSNSEDYNYKQRFLDKAISLKEEREEEKDIECNHPHHQRLIKIKEIHKECLNNEVLEEEFCSKQKGESIIKSRQIQRECLKPLKRKHSGEIKQWLESFGRQCHPNSQSESKSCYKRFLKMIVTVPLEIRRYDIDGKLTNKKISGGKYDINIQLITNSSPDGNSFYRMHEKVCHITKGFRQDGDQKNPHLLFSCSLEIPLHKENETYTKLFMEVKPAKDSSLPFKTFQGLYTLDEKFIQDSGGSNIKIDNDIDKYYQEILGEDKEVDIFQDIEIRDIFDSQKITFSEFTVPRLEDTGEGTIKYSNILTEDDCLKNDNGVTRTVVFSGTICLRDKLLRRKYPGQRFRIFVEKPDENGDYFTEEVFRNDPKEPFYKTVGSGCIEQLPIALSNKIYERQRYIQVSVYFVSEDRNLYAVAKPALNPWQKQFQAYIDGTNFPEGESEVRLSPNHVNYPKMIINQFKSVNMFPSYGLDHLLNIHLYHRLYFLFQAFIQRLGDVAHGSFAASREFMRDGYYLVRLLILRNPQEEGNLQRVQHDWKIRETRKQLFPVKASKDLESYKKAKYITHHDGVVKAEANYINFYAPFYIDTKQLYYLSSRNLISIEIAPVDPSNFIYHEVKEDGECEVDEEATKWVPYFNHELVNGAFLGAFNLSALTNWNPLLPVKGFSSDEIIQTSDEGREYKHFDLRKDHQINNLQPVRCVDHSNFSDWPYDDWITSNISIKADGAVETVDKYVKKIDSRIDLNNNIYKTSPEFSETLTDIEQMEKAENCFQNNDQFASFMEKKHQRIEKDKSFFSDENVLQSFAEKNALKIIDLSGEDQDQFVGRDEFVKDIENAISALKEKSQQIYYDPLLIYQVIPERLKTIFTYRKLGRSSEGDHEVVYDSGTGEEISAEKEYNSDREYLKDLMMEKCPGVLYNFGTKEDICRYVKGKKYIIPTPKQLVWKLELSSYKVFMEAVQNSCSMTELEKEIFESSTHQQVDELSFFSLVKKSIMTDVRKWINIGNEGGSSLSDSFKITSHPEDTCSSDILRNYTEIVYDKRISKYEGNSDNLLEQQQKIKLMLDKIKEITTVKPTKFVELSHSTLQEIINKKQIYEKRKNEVYSFSQSLCQFWFDSFLPGYLEPSQILSAFTNYITKFDYYKVLESEAPKSYDDMLNISTQFVQAIGMHTPDEKEQKNQFYSCHMRYKQCILSDYCQHRTFSEKGKTKYCENYLDKEKKSCIRLVREECERDPHFPLCPSEMECKNETSLFPSCSRKTPGLLYDHFEKSCNKTVYGFCRDNVSHPICDKFSGRCLKNFRECMKSEDIEELFHPRNILNDKFGTEENPVLEACLKDPYQFFKFENKLVVYELSEDNPHYESGFLRNMSIVGNHSVESAKNWASSHNKNLSASGEIGLNLPNIIGSFLKWIRVIPKVKDGAALNQRSFFNIGLSLRGSESISADTSYGSRRSTGARVSLASFFMVGEIKIHMFVKKFRKCLVIKPNPSAFYRHNFGENWLGEGEPSKFKENEVWTTIAMNQDFRKVFVTRPGIIICNQLQNHQKEPITENYYYISQVFENNSMRFLNMSDIANRPFVNILRGKKEFRKYYHLMRVIMDGDNGDVFENGDLYSPPEDMFKKQSFPVEEARGLSLVIREFKETGFHPGIYDYAENADDEIDSILNLGDGVGTKVRDFFTTNVNLMNNLHKIPDEPIY